MSGKIYLIYTSLYILPHIICVYSKHSVDAMDVDDDNPFVSKEIGQRKGYTKGYILLYLLYLLSLTYCSVPQVNYPISNFGRNKLPLHVS